MATDVQRLPEFKERFTALRGQRTQAKFADFLGIARPTVGFYENGDRIPDALVLKNIAQKCNVSTDWLLGLAPIDVRTPNIEVQAIAKKIGLTETAIVRLSNYHRPYKRKDETGVTHHGYEPVPAPHEISELIEHKQFDSFLRSLKSMKLVEADEITSIRMQPLRKILGKRGLWEFFKQQTVAIITDILIEIAPSPPEDRLDIPSSKLLEHLGIDEKQYWEDYLTGKTDGVIRDEDDDDSIWE